VSLLVVASLTIRTSQPFITSPSITSWSVSTRWARVSEELTESKQYLVGSLPRTLETNTGIAAFLQSAEFFGLGLDYDVRVPGLLQAVTRDEVHEAARRAVDPAKATLVIAGPYDGPIS
jgi:predicted Zn-dependent peptidase